MIRIALVGDVMITRPLPSQGYEGQHLLTQLIQEHEVKCANLETTIHRREGYPSAFPGGTWAMADPVCLEDIKSLGFNVLNTANNHSMDYAHKGLLATHRHLRRAGLTYFGTGQNLAEASAPLFTECSEGRVAFVGVTSSFHDSDAAGHQRRDMQGRPGVNPLRHKSVCEISPENFTALRHVAEQTGVNDYHHQAIREGFLLPRENLTIGPYEFVQGGSNVLRTFPLEKDVERIAKSVSEARKQADCVVVSVHSHQFSNRDKSIPAEFLSLFSRTCIDAGASVIVGHGPHILRGIEVYHGGVICYSLGNFIFQNETVSHLPAEFYEKYSLAHDDGVGTAMDKRSQNGTKGPASDPDSWKSVLVSIALEPDTMSIRLVPVELGFHLERYNRGLPKISGDTAVLERIQALSVPFGTEIHIRNGEGFLKVSRRI